MRAASAIFLGLLFSAHAAGGFRFGRPDEREHRQHVVLRDLANWQIGQQFERVLLELPHLVRGSVVVPPVRSKGFPGLNRCFPENRYFPPSLRRQRIAAEPGEAAFSCASRAPVLRREFDSHIAAPNTGILQSA